MPVFRLLNMNWRRIFLFISLLLALVILAACAAAPSKPTGQEAIPTRVAVEKTQFPAQTALPSPSPGISEGEQPIPTQMEPGSPTQGPTSIPHQVEIEWPERMRLQDSDTIRLALLPSRDRYILQAEFPDHTIQGQTIDLPQKAGADLYGVASVHGLGFDISPQGEQIQFLEPGEPATWRWAIRPTQPGANRLVVDLALRWTPEGQGAQAKNAIQRSLFSHSLDIQVVRFLGLGQPQALVLGLLGLLTGSGLSLGAWLFSIRKPSPPLQIVKPNPALIIEPLPNIQISSEECDLLRALFVPYKRLVLEREFLSGYSGARTFLAIPVRPDGQADAHTIIKLGGAGDILQEYQNYENLVKDRLPPVTARIQHAPISLPVRRARSRRGLMPDPRLAALQYTFIGLPGSRPTSLGNMLRQVPDPALLWKLFESFGPNWWMQRSPYTFRLAQEYDRLLPPHLIIEPEPQFRGKETIPLSAGTNPTRLTFSPGDLVSIDLDRSSRWHVERREAGRSLALTGLAGGGHPPLRIRWRGAAIEPGTPGRVRQVRAQILRQLTAGLELCSLPDPIFKLDILMEERVKGSRSTIHGDLNLENILVGPGDILWLIDFAQTRTGHPLYDFAHLEAEIIAHVVSAQAPEPAVYLESLRGHPPVELEQCARLLETVHTIARRCLYDPAISREYELARYAACLGALKFANLDRKARQLLYLTAAEIGEGLSMNTPEQV